MAYDWATLNIPVHRFCDLYKIYPLSGSIVHRRDGRIAEGNGDEAIANA